MQVLLWCVLMSQKNANEMQSVLMSPRTSERQHLIDEIDQLRRELAARQSFQRPTPGSVVYAYHELLERHYVRLDRLPLE
jgi:hypothetical protein